MRIPLSLCLAFAALTTASQAQVKCTLAQLPHSEADKTFATGNFPAAETLFTTQLAASPTIANFTGLVHTQLQQDKLPEALASAQRAVAALPASADAQALLGDALTRSGDIPAAGDAYMKAIKLDPCSASAHFGFGRLNDLIGRHLTAAKQFNFAHGLAPNDPEITIAYLNLLPPEQRLPPVRSFLATHPALPPARLAQLENELAILNQHLTCHTEPFNAQSLGLEPLFQNGRYRRSWGLKTRINDAAMPLLELDSSVDGIVLNDDDAFRAQVRPLTTAPTDRNASYLAVAEEIHIGDLTYRNCPVTVVPNNQVDNRNSLIGTSFFRDHAIHIDYVAMTLKLTTLPAPPTGGTGFTDQFIADNEKDWSPVYVAGPHILLPTLINKKGPFLFAMDTGIGHSILSPAITRSQLSYTVDQTINLRGYSGEIVKVIPHEGGGVTDVADVIGPNGKPLPVGRPVKFPTLRFTSNEIPDDSDVTFDITPLSHADGIEISGLLGFHILSYFSLDLNYRDALARVLFDQNRRYHVQAAQLAF